MKSVDASQRAEAKPQQQGDRKAGIERVTQLCVSEFLTADDSKNAFFTKLEEKSNGGLLLVLQKINASARNIEFSEAHAFSSDIRIKTNDGTIIRETGFVFPEPQEREKMFANVVQAIGELSQNRDEQAEQKIAQLLFNTAIYLHPFDDGNGRTARILYFLSSPHIKRDQSTISESVKRLVEARDARINEYHDQLGLVLFEEMLRKRGLFDGPGNDGTHACTMIDTKVLGFDGQYLQLIAAADELTEEEKKLYNKSKEANVLAFDGYDWPQDVQKRISARTKKVRVEFVERVIELSKEDLPDWILEPLEKAIA